MRYVSAFHLLIVVSILSFSGLAAAEPAPNAQAKPSKVDEKGPQETDENRGIDAGSVSVNDEGPASSPASEGDPGPETCDQGADLEPVASVEGRAAEEDARADKRPLLWTPVSDFFPLPGGDDPPENVELPDVGNLFIDLTTGVLNEPGDSATAFGSIGFNYGLPLVRDYRVGLQIGGDIALHEGAEFEADMTGGVFIRDLPLTENIRGGAAVLSDYRHTAEHADLVGLRGVVGVSTRNGHHAGVRGTYPLNDETITRAPTFTEVQELSIRHDVFWGYDVSRRLGVEASVGYQSAAVDETVFGLSASYWLSKRVAVAPMFEMNTAGDYAVGVSVVYDFGGSGRRSTLTHFASRDANDFTPFRKRSFPLLLAQTERIARRSGSALVPPVPGEPPPPGDGETPPGDGDGDGGGAELPPGDDDDDDDGEPPPGPGDDDDDDDDGEPPPGPGDDDDDDDDGELPPGPGDDDDDDDDDGEPPPGPGDDDDDIHFPPGRCDDDDHFPPGRGVDDDVFPPGRDAGRNGFPPGHPRGTPDDGLPPGRGLDRDRFPPGRGVGEDHFPPRRCDDGAPLPGPLGLR